MNLLIAFAAVLACSAAAFCAGLFVRVATVMAVAARQGWRPPATETPSKAENPFRGNGGAR